MGKFTQIASKEGYGAFKKECRRIFEFFQKYGPSVLDVEFSNSDETETKLRKLFLEFNTSNIDKKILEFWNQNYMRIISQVSDLKFIPPNYLIYTEKYCELNPHAYNGDPRKFRLSTTFFQQLKKNPVYQLNSINYTFAIDNRYLYLFQINGFPYSDLDICIFLQHKIPLSKIVTE